MPDAPITIDHFSDVLCIWAYGAQIRVDELRRQFPDQVRFTYRFLPLFGDTARRIGEGWAERGGFPGFGEHAREVADDWDHVTVHPGVWSETAPASSTSPHLFLKAVQLLETNHELAAGPVPEFEGRRRFEQAIWETRRRFYADAEDIGRRDVQAAAASACSATWATASWRPMCASCCTTRARARPAGADCAAGMGGGDRHAPGDPPLRMDKHVVQSRAEARDRPHGRRQA